MGFCGCAHQEKFEILVFLGHDFLHSGTYLSECFRGKIFMLG